MLNGLTQNIKSRSRSETLFVFLIQIANSPKCSKCLSSRIKEAIDKTEIKFKNPQTKANKTN